MQMPRRTENCRQAGGRPGPGTCPRLTQYIVCRNCPEFSAFALRLLGRPAPPEYVREWTAHLAGAPLQADAETAVPVLVFRIASEWLALRVEAVGQVTEPCLVHALPHRKLPVQGVVSIRGELVVCVSLAAILGIADGQIPASGPRSPVYKRLIILHGEGGRVAFQPDEVQGVQRYCTSQLLRPPVTLARTSASQFTIGLIHWGDRTAGCLDPDRLLEALTRSLA